MIIYEYKVIRPTVDAKDHRTRFDLYNQLYGQEGWRIVEFGPLMSDQGGGYFREFTIELATTVASPPVIGMDVPTTLDDPATLPGYVGPIKLR